MPQAVPRTANSPEHQIFNSMNILILPLVPNMSGVQPYKIAHMAFKEKELQAK